MDGQHFRLCILGEFRWRGVPECGMKSVAGGEPRSNDDPGAGVGQLQNQHFVQELVRDTAIKAVERPVLHRFSRRDVGPLDGLARTPGQDRG